MSERDEQLDALYAKMPELQCKGLCQECCGPIAMSPAEFKRLHDRVGDRIRGEEFAEGIALIGRNYKCPLLNKDGKCSVYDIRPMICRMWGAVKEMQCPHGCVPAKWMTKLRTFELLKAANDVK